MAKPWEAESGLFATWNPGEAHVWFDGGNGPQKRPTDRMAPPATLDWDLWLGPAPERPYHPCYLPASWRG
jgi:hypothetical protein